MESETAETTAKGATAINATVAELLSIAAAMGAGFEAGVEFHVNAARKLGLSDEDLVQAASVGLKLRQAATESAVHSARALLAPEEKGEGKCGCGHDHGGCGDEHGH